MNLMAVDAQRVMQLVQSFNQIWAAPLQICVAIYFLYVTMGVAVMAGVGMLVLLVPLNLLLARLVRKIQVKHLYIQAYSIKRAKGRVASTQSHNGSRVKRHRYFWFASPCHKSAKHLLA